MALTRRDALLSLAAAPLGFAFPVPSIGAAATGEELKPGDDFYRYVNAADLHTMTIPAGHWDYGQFNVVGKRVTDQTGDLVRRAARGKGRQSATAERVAAVYRSVIDETAIERTTIPRLKQELARILSARTHAELGRLMAHPRSSSLVAFNIFPAQGEWMPYIDQHNQNQPMFGLATHVYESAEADAQKTREAYQACIARVFDLAGVRDGTRRATDILALETEIARRQWGFERIRDRRANLHIMTKDELEAFAPGLPWREMLQVRGLSNVKAINLGTDSAVSEQARLFREKPVDAWRSWLACSWIRNAIDIMPASMRDAYWRFSGEVVRGGAPRPSRDEEALQFVNARMPLDVGRLYVEAAFPEESRRRAEELLAYLKGAMAERLRQTAWLDPASRAEALAKLDSMVLKAGYPRSWPEPETIPLRDDDPAGNLDALLQRDWRLQLARLTSPGARRELWYQAPQVVDASYSVLLNSIEVPAAILQPPFFTADAHPAANFGAIGAIIGHEMGHAFDDQGMLFDSKGVIRSWMSGDAQAAFAAQAERLVGQYGAFEPLPGLKLNGRRTLGENMADLSGLSLALRAYQSYAQDHGLSATGGKEAVRLLFRSWAKVWVYKGPESAIRHIVANSYHSPAAYRVNGAVRNIDAWYDAFSVEPGDALYLPPQERVRLW